MTHHLNVRDVSNDNLELFMSVINKEYVASQTLIFVQILLLYAGLVIKMKKKILHCRNNSKIKYQNL